MKLILGKLYKVISPFVVVSANYRMTSVGPCSREEIKPGTVFMFVKVQEDSIIQTDEMVFLHDGKLVVTERMSVDKWSNRHLYFEEVKL